MRIKSFEFNLRELAGSFGDFGTLLPLAVGYIVVCGLNPTGLLIMMGLANIVTGIIYHLPMPIEPMKVLAAVAIAQEWSPSMIYASGFGMGAVWLVLGGTGAIGWIARVTPNGVVRGVQVALGVMLAIPALKMMSTSWILGVVAILITVTLRRNRYAPAALVLVALGVTILMVRGQGGYIGVPGITGLPRTGFGLDEVWRTFLLAGFAQIPLTATNAVLATASLITVYWPGRSVSERRLSINMGVMNLISPFFGGMPMCHGAGGLAGQYFFGARTGGTNIIEGAIEICLGVFLGASIAGLFAAFPKAIVGAMMFMVGVELAKLGRDIEWKSDFIPAGVTLAVALLSNMAFGFLAGLIVHHGSRYIGRRKGGVSNG